MQDSGVKRESMTAAAAGNAAATRGDAAIEWAAQRGAMCLFLHRPAVKGVEETRQDKPPGGG
jgi:hypothetical protein